MVVVLFILPLGGCVYTGPNVDDGQNTSNVTNDVFVFSKIATRISLNESKMKPEDIGLVKTYLVAVRDFLSVPGQPNFNGARDIAKSSLPEKYKVYGLSVVDLIERFVKKQTTNQEQEHALVVQIIDAAVKGALEAVEEFSPTEG